MLSIVPLLSPAPLGLEPRGYIFHEISLRFFPEVEAWDSEAIRTYIGRRERGTTGVTVESLASILAVLDVSLAEFFRPFNQPLRLRTPRKRD